MIRGTDIAGLVGVILLTIAIICYLIRPVTNLNWRRHIVCATIPILIWKASSLITILRGITGDLSISSVLFLLLFLSNNLSIRHNLKIKDLSQPPHSSTLNYLILACGAIVLYPFALGVGHIDTYRLGFGNTYFLILLAYGTIIAYRNKLQLVAWSILLAVATWTIGWYESTNLWDYLLDPWISLYAIGIVIWASVKYMYHQCAYGLRFFRLIIHASPTCHR